MGGKRRVRPAIDSSHGLAMRILEAAPGGIVHVNAQGAIQAANAEALRILGMSFDALSRQYVVDFETETIWEDGSPCPASEYPVSRALITGEDQPRATIGIRRPDGDTSWAVFTAVPIKNEDGDTTGAVATFLDITDRMKMEELKEQLSVAERLASLGTLAAGVAHEINNPLTYILIKLRLLLERLEKDRSADIDDVETALSGAERIASIVRDLGAFTKSGGNDNKSVNIANVVKLAIKMAEIELRYRARLTVEVDEDLFVRGDDVRIGQVMINLIVNAAHAIEAGDISNNSISIRAHRDGTKARIVVEDTGHGIDPATLGRIFQPFVTTKDPDQGSGLGLHVCYQIVDALGGSIHAESTVGKGSRFTVELPVFESKTQSSQRAKDTLSPERSGSARILVVDDEPLLRAIFKQQLSPNEVVVVESGREALELLRDQSFDLVLCDLIMPDLTGMDVHSELERRGDPHAHSMVFMTGGAFTERSRVFADSTSNRVLRKPFDLQELRDVVQAQITLS